MSFAVLVTLARLGDVEGVSQRRLLDELGLTSGTISVRIDRLVEQGLVRRRADPEDKRNVHVSLTADGRERFERAVLDHLDNERRLVSALTLAEREQLAGLLRKVLVEFEGSGPPDGAQVHLGVTLAPSHVGVAMRRAVGLPDQPGLLIRGLEEDGPAALAGLRAGDVLVRAGRRELRSIAGLYAAIDDGAAAGRIDLHVVRGVDDVAATVHLDEAAGEDRGRLAATPGRHRREEHRI